MLHKIGNEMSNRFPDGLFLPGNYRNHQTGMRFCSSCRFMLPVSDYQSELSTAVIIKQTRVHLAKKKKEQDQGDQVLFSTFLNWFHRSVPNCCLCILFQYFFHKY